ncbi:MAG: hypothetical protein CMP41_01605 [Rickettsiales bacterium]|nr:hypothetical protein [Rickettsiales bacterium]
MYRTNNSKNKPFSLIDIGSFSIRLVIYDSLSLASRTLFNEKVICNLGKVVSKKGKLGNSDIDNVINVLERFTSIANSVSNEKIIILATAAVRIADNRDYFLRCIFNKFKIKVTLLSEKEEGELAALGVIYSHKNVEGIVGDLGGGSLELTEVVGGENINFINSLKIGHTFLNQKGIYFDKTVYKFIKENLNKNKIKECEKFYAVGGSFRALAKLHMYLTEKNIKIIQDYVIPAKDIDKVIKKAVFYENKFNPEILNKITKSRRESLPYALNVLEKLIEFYSFKEIHFSSSGIREGFILQQLKIKERVINNLKNERNTFIFQIQRLANKTISSNMVKHLYSWILQCSDFLEFNNQLLLSACWISNIAWDVHPEHRRLYAMERILWYPFYGITRTERIELSIIMYFRHSNALKDDLIEKYYNTVDKNVRMRCKFIGQILRLAHHITGSVSEKNLGLCKIKKKKDVLKLIILEKSSLFQSQAISRGLKNAALALDIKKSEIKLSSKLSF